MYIYNMYVFINFFRRNNTLTTRYIDLIRVIRFLNLGE